ncbi:MAG: glycosyltransferase family 4 protein [Flavobacteriales bacterium]|nr:glycosyltransferase family 4 protein [Flavobacteriales bacterium]
MKRKRILFVDRGAASYIERDIDLLRERFEVIRLSFLARDLSGLPGALFIQFFRCLVHLNGSDVVFVHFAGWGSLLPLALARLGSRPSVLFLHGADAVSLPDLNYGNFRKWPLSAVTRLSLKLASRIIVVDGSLISSTNPIGSNGPTKQGIRHFVPDLRTPVRVIPHGFDTKVWFPSEVQKEIDVVTVASNLGDQRIRRLKGVDKLLSVAADCPELRFLVIGWDGATLSDLPSNVNVLPRVPNEELPGIFRRTRCYAQLSLSEGFGCALVEAMCCGCVPVVNKVGAMPGILGTHGRSIEASQDQELIEAIRWACDSPPERAFEVAHYAMTRFDLRERREALFRSIGDLIK